MSISPPQTEAELWSRASAIAQQTLGDMAAAVSMAVPSDFRREKGFIGQLLEQILGATAGNLAKPDFTHLGIELKTLPLNANGLPKESTYVSIVPLMSTEPLSWPHCELYQKLRRILWIPYFFDKTLEPRYWRLSNPVLWSPSLEDETILREDWYELMSLVQMGQLDKISARLGQYLQIRPKAMNADVRTQGIGSHGECVRTSPRGFYLRTSFTARIVHFSNS
ncbi:MAG: mismatch repair endonuclease MutH [Gammaproteobacteria bacterium]|jgi:DNA mismatch repair protein MutH|nr:mismatch repair endonuclease MutH [Gammaproteobacteria bacterium]